jgi:hypothetical protein
VEPSGKEIFVDEEIDAIPALERFAVFWPVDDLAECFAHDVLIVLRGRARYARPPQTSRCPYLRTNAKLLHVDYILYVCIVRREAIMTYSLFITRRLALCALALCCVQSTFAQSLERSFPEQAKICKSLNHGLPQEPYIDLGTGAPIRLSAALVIRNEANRIVVNQELPRQFSGMCIIGAGGDLEKIWILTPEQAARALERAKKNGG